MNKVAPLVLLVIAVIAAGFFIAFKSHKDESMVSNDVKTKMEEDEGVDARRLKDELLIIEDSVDLGANSEEEFDVPPPADPNFIGASNVNSDGGLWSSPNTTNKTTPKKYAHLDEENVNRAYVEVARLGIEELEVGRDFKIIIPQTDNDYDVQVTKTYYHPNGDKAVKGTILHNDGETYSVTITQGANATYGTFGTPDGVYVLEADGESGWLASKDDLIKNQDRSKTDEVYITPKPTDTPQEIQ